MNDGSSGYIKRHRLHYENSQETHAIEKLCSPEYRILHFQQSSTVRDYVVPHGSHAVQPVKNSSILSGVHLSQYKWLYVSSGPTPDVSIFSA
jgi:hypothetical protein